MSRFDFEPVKGIGEVTFGKGKQYELEFCVPTPVGRVWGDLAIELLDIVNKFGEEMDTEGPEGKAAVAAFGYLRTHKKFWKTYLPSVLGVKGTSEEPEFEAFIAKWGTNAEIVGTFMEAASMIVRYSFNADETEEALAKLEGGEAEEEGASLVLDGMTLPVS
jgi:hypothetical protein